MQQGAGFEKDLLWEQGRGHLRTHFNIMAMILNLLLPWGMFIFTYVTLTSALRYELPIVAFVIFTVALLACAVCCLLALRIERRGQSSQWYGYAAISLTLAALAGGGLGHTTFTSNFLPYYDMETLNQYVDVNPMTARGQSMADVGRAIFLGDSFLNTNMTMGFKNYDMYCVAPIMLREDQKIVDFWAAGTNCCRGAKDFRCGEYANPAAKAGLRVVDGLHRPYFHLAVQQAEAAYGVTAPHPLFFEWMQDPSMQLTKLWEEGTRSFWVSLWTVLIINMVCVFAYSAVKVKEAS
mmetsp:Transcript_3264/g.7779  ORF Transcript_3264/g.7779 Transcript_3264/m.7779 type:complete len:294 (-) Transcript_3264:172-1053(-)